MKSSATITIKNKKSDNFLYQTILISPFKKSDISFFSMDKYEMGKHVDDLLDTIYLGDGVNIFFRDKQKYRNQTIIKYEIVNNIDIDLSEKKYHITGEVPNHDGCNYCMHWNNSSNGKSSCKLYKKFLKRPKIYCVDYQES